MKNGRLFDYRINKNDENQLNNIINEKCVLIEMNYFNKTNKNDKKSKKKKKLINK